MSTFSIYHNLLVNAPIEKVFNAFTLPEHLDNWRTLKSSGKPKLNAVYNFNFTDAYNWYGKVYKVEKNKEFFIQMTDSDKDWNPTIFGCTFEEVEKGTYVRFSHKKWVTDNDHYKYSSFCWAILLNAFKNYIEKGIVIPFKDRE